MTPGGARRTLIEQLGHFNFEVTEICLDTAAAVTSRPVVVPFAEHAPRVRPALRVPLRYADMVQLARAWRVASRSVLTAGADVVVAHPCQFLQAPPPLRLLRVPSVYFCHEPRRVDYELNATNSRRAVTRGVYGALYRWQRASDRAGVARATELVTNSRYTATTIMRAYGRIATPVPLGVPESFRPDPRPAEGLHLLSVGSLIPSKGHDLVVRAAARTKRRWPVVIVAPRADEGEAQRLLTLARATNVQLQIAVAVSDAELCRLYQQAVATMYLAEREPLGLASLEAQACGSPVIAAAEGGLPETFLEGRTGWGVPRDPAAAARRVDALEEGELRRAVSLRAAAHGSGFTWKRSAQAFEQRVRDALQAGGETKSPKPEPVVGAT
jgi:glycosyltransferase involved in cell wall biosynthesis